MMEFKPIIANVVMGVAGYVGTRTAVLTAAADPAPTMETVSYVTTFNAPYSFVGFHVPNWWGIVFYVAFLVLGAAASVHQTTPVDQYLTHPALKPLYSFGFGVLITLFVIPQFYPDVTIWGLIWPAAFTTAIGSVVIYYVIAFFSSGILWDMINSEAMGRARAIWRAIIGSSK